MVGLIGLISVTAEAAAPPADDPLFGDGAHAASDIYDPMEPVNRVVLKFNQGLDHWVLDPVTDVYDMVVPTGARRAVRRAIFNLDAPAVFVNDVLQLAPANAGITASRFALNTVFGACGLIDFAELVGIPGHQSDFGQTLGLYGVSSGPFLILPLFGPTTLRDGTGFLVDFWFRPTTYFLTPLSNIVFTSIRDGTAGLAALDAHGPALEALEASSIDFYAALRSAYMQDREGQIRNRRSKRPDTSLVSR